MNHSTQINILVADDHPIYQESTEIALYGHPEFVICERAASGVELLEKLETAQPDVILMDNHMFVMDGIEATKKIKERYPQIKVMAYFSAPRLSEITGMLQAGADGCLQKSSDGDEMRLGIKSLIAGHNWFCSACTKIVVEQLQGKGI